MQPRVWFFVGALVIASASACDGGWAVSQGTVDHDTWERQAAEYDRQSTEAARQLERASEQADRTDEQLDRAEAQAQRYERLLERWEAQADRVDRILAVVEERLGEEPAAGSGPRSPGPRTGSR